MSLKFPHNILEKVNLNEYISRKVKVEHNTQHGNGNVKIQGL